MRPERGTRNPHDRGPGGTGYVWRERFTWHDTGTHTGAQPWAHPEGSEAKARVHSLVEVSGLLDHLDVLRVSPVSVEDVQRIHSLEHIDRMMAMNTDVRGGDAGDGGSPFAQGGFDIALLAAGGTWAALEAVLTGRCRNAYALVRPPGHHAGHGAGMGFCLINNIAVAVARARQGGLARRILVVDWDVHHGNGTQDIFYDDPDVLTISLHQADMFPRHSGGMEETGGSGGPGANINVPLPAGSGEGAYQYALDTVVRPAAAWFQPDVIVVASGYDASILDPLGRMMLTSASYDRMCATVMEIADELCLGRVVVTHEGGYSPTYTPYCALAVVARLARQTVAVDDEVTETFRDIEGTDLQPHQRAVIDAVAARHAALRNRSS
ncbi:class II histone deacetylase [Nocardioides sp.]|uniref:class II histone deacetylase n=1 Tax=Nocardioides sp. TaxID=35761 RepID=UPI003D0C36CC